MWTRQHDEVALVVDLQKSPHSRVHYVNLGVSVHCLSDGSVIKIERCQIFARLDMLVQEGIPENRLARALKGPHAAQVQATLDSLSDTKHPVNPLILSQEAIEGILKDRPRIDLALDLDDRSMNDEERGVVITNALETVGIPFLQKCDSLQKICQELGKGTLGTDVVWGVVHDLCKQNHGTG
jgi:hypothetical protein